MNTAKPGAQKSSAIVAYSMLHSSFWMLFCVGYGYVSYYLSALNYTAGEIGLLTACAGAIAAFFQVLLGRISDHSRIWNWKRILEMASLLTIVLLFFIFLTSNKLVAGLLFALFLILLSTMMPFVNAANFDYLRSGIRVDFGTARAIGSLGYALISMALAAVTAHFGYRALPVGGIFLAISLLLVLFSMPPAGLSTTLQGDSYSEIKQDKPSGPLNFLLQYPSYSFMLLGTVLLIGAHNMTSTYILQIIEHIGGNSSNLGPAIALAAISELPVLFAFTQIRKKFAPALLLLISAIAFLLKFSILLLADRVIVIYLAQLMQFLSYALFAAASVYYADQAVAEKDRNSGQAFIGGALTVGAVLGNLSGGWCLQFFGVKAMIVLSILLGIAGTSFFFMTFRQDTQQSNF